MAMVDRTGQPGQTLEEIQGEPPGSADGARAGTRLVVPRSARGAASRSTICLTLKSRAHSEDGGTVTLDGPLGIVLNSISVQALAMALHELTTNALKYGALGRKNARLNISWRAQAESGSSWIFVDWRESGVETAQSNGPRGVGNGQRLIEDALPYQFGARTSFAIEPDGVHCTIALPLSRTSDRGDPGWPIPRFVIAVFLLSRTSSLSPRRSATNLKAWARLSLGRSLPSKKPSRRSSSNPEIDAAILDVNLGGALAYPVADALLARNIPFIFTSGYEDGVLSQRYPQIRNCPKPYLFLEMERVLASACVKS